MTAFSTSSSNATLPAALSTESRRSVSCWPTERSTPNTWATKSTTQPS
ncbi:MAG: hypothetical protein ACK467_01070 [Opitutia bacterium]